MLSLKRKFVAVAVAVAVDVAVAVAVAVEVAVAVDVTVAVEVAAAVDVAVAVAVKGGDDGQPAPVNPTSPLGDRWFRGMPHAFPKNPSSQNPSSHRGGVYPFPTLPRGPRTGGYFPIRITSDVQDLF